MYNQVKSFMVIILALSGLALLISSQVWAQGPKAQEIIFDDGAGNNYIKVQYNPQGEVAGVWFFDVDPSCENEAPCWVLQQPQKGIICTCLDGDEPCSETLADNLNNPNVTLDCHDIKRAGPDSTGCPMIGSWDFVSPSGSAYVRR